MSTNKPSIGSEVLEIAYEIFRYSQISIFCTKILVILVKFKITSYNITTYNPIIFTVMRYWGGGGTP